MSVCLLNTSNSEFSHLQFNPPTTSHPIHHKSLSLTPRSEAERAKTPDRIENGPNYHLTQVQSPRHHPRPFPESNGIIPIFGHPPSYHQIFLSGEEHSSALDPQPAFLCAKPASDLAGAADAANQNIHIFIPNRQSMAMYTHVCMSYAYVMLFAQRQIGIINELPDKSPPSFAELRREIPGFAEEGGSAATGM